MYAENNSGGFFMEETQNTGKNFNSERKFARRNFVPVTTKQIQEA